MAALLDFTSNLLIMVSKESLNLSISHMLIMVSKESLNLSISHMYTY